MSGIIGKITGLDTIREDMKKRVDEILKAGNEWKFTAERLTATLEKLIEEISKGNPHDVTPLKTELKKLATQTRRLAEAFEMHRRTLQDVSKKI